MEFHQCLQQAGIQDLLRKECRYSWTSEQEFGQRIFSRIDTIMVNSHWLADFSSSGLSFFQMNSDHFPGSLKFFGLHDHGSEPFKFFRHYGQGLALSYSRHTYHLRKLSRKVFRDVNSQYAQAEQNLNRIQMEIQQNTSNAQLYNAKEEAWADFNLWKTKLESFYMQKSKENWLNLGDTNK